MTTNLDLSPSSRRLFLGNTTKWALSAGAVALLGGNDVLAQAMGGPVSADVNILNVALGLEYEGINA